MRSISSWICWCADEVCFSSFDTRLLGRDALVTGVCAASLKTVSRLHAPIFHDKYRLPI